MKTWCAFNAAGWSKNAWKVLHFPDLRLTYVICCIHLLLNTFSARVKYIFVNLFHHGWWKIYFSSTGKENYSEGYRFFHFFKSCILQCIVYFTVVNERKNIQDFCFFLFDQCWPFSPLPSLIYILMLSGCFFVFQTLDTVLHENPRRNTQTSRSVTDNHSTVTVSL